MSTSTNLLTTSRDGLFWLRVRKDFLLLQGMALRQYEKTHNAENLTRAEHYGVGAADALEQFNATQHLREDTR